MARKPRVEYKGAVYHVTHRGNNREFIFEDAEDKRYLLSTLAEMRNPVKVKIAENINTTSAAIGSLLSRNK